MNSFLRALSRQIESLFDASLRRRGRVRLATGLALIAVAFGLPHLRTELRLYDLVDPSFPSTARLREMKGDFREGNVVLLFFAPRDPGRALSADEFCRIDRWAHLQSLENGELSDVFSPSHLRRAREYPGNRLWFPELFATRCAPEGPERGRSDESFRQDLRNLSHTQWSGIFTDEAHRDVAIRFGFRDSQEATRFGKFDPAPIGRLIADAERDLLPKIPAVRMRMNGPAAFEWHYKNVLEHDGWINPAILLLFIVFFRIFFGTWRAGLLYAGTLILTATLLFGAMGAVGLPLDLLTTNLFLMTAIAGVEDFLFISHQMLEDARTAGPGADWRASIREMILPGFYTTLTTMTGFVSLGVSDLRIIRNFGYCAAAAALIEWAAVFFALPAVVRRGWVDPARAWRPRWLARLETLTVSRAGVAAALVAFALGIYGFFHLNYDDSPARNFPAAHPFSESYRYLRQSRGWEGQISLLFPRPGQPVAGRYRAIDAVLAKVRLDSTLTGNLAKIDSPNDFLEFQTRGLSPRAAAVARGELSTTEAYANYVADDGAARVGLYLRSVDLRDLRETLSRLTEICRDADCVPAGENVVFLDYSWRIIATLVQSLGTSLALVGLILLGLSRAASWRARLALLFTSFWGTVVMMGVMAALRTPVNLVTSMFAAVLVGLTGDNAVQFLFAARAPGRRSPDLQRGVRRRGGAAILLGFLLVGASACFLGLTLEPMRTLGRLFMMGFTVTLVGDLFLLKGMLGEGPI